MLSRMWWTEFDPGSNAVEVYVRYLLGKIGGARIKTARPGFRLRQTFGKAAQTGLTITVCHFPPGTSKWNKAA